MNVVKLLELDVDKRNDPQHPCMVYLHLPYFTIKKPLNVGKYTSPMDGLGDRTNANLGSFLSVPKCFLIETTGFFSEREQASGQQVSVF